MQKITRMQRSLNVAVLQITIYIYILEKNYFLGKNLNTGLQLVFIINEDLNLRRVNKSYFPFY